MIDVKKNIVDYNKMWNYFNEYVEIFIIYYVLYVCKLCMSYLWWKLLNGEYVCIKEIIMFFV